VLREEGINWNIKYKMNIKLISQAILIFLAAIFFQINAYADSSAELTQLLLGIRTMQADFTQKITDKKAKPLQQTQGRMALERPGKFRWEVTKPIAQLIVANGTRLWIYDRDLEQVTIRAFKSATGQTPALLLSDNNLTLGKDFFVTQTGDASAPVFLLKPKDKSNFESIKLSFSNNVIHEMELKDHLGHTTLIQFRDVALNAPLSERLFTFKPPSGIDIIDETKQR